MSSSKGWTTQVSSRVVRPQKCEEQVTSFSYFQGSSSRMSSVIRSEAIEGEYCSENENLLPWVQVAVLYTNAFLAAGGFGII